MNVEDELPRLLTVRAVAELARVSEKTIRRTIAAGKLPCMRIGTLVRVSEKDVQRWLETRKEG